MHIVTRQVNEGIVIGGNLHVTVLEVHEDRVRLAISCPDAVPSYREETLYFDRAADPDDAQLLPELLLR